MGNRLTKIYTRSGDAGETGLADGSRISKDDMLMHAQGDIDELNSILGLLVCKMNDESYAKIILNIQNDLFDLGAEISLSKASLSQTRIKQENVDWLEKNLDKLNNDLLPLKEFILPGGGEAAALCHLARSVCRRAERNLVAVNRKQSLSPVLLAYVNRLSDLLFVMARSITKQMEEKETCWQPERLKDH